MTSRDVIGAARNVLLTGAYYSGAGALYKRLRGRRGGVLSYHNVLPREELSGASVHAVDVSIEAFEHQLAYLDRQGLLLSVSDSWPSQREGFYLSFDDGMLNNYEIVAPRLRTYGIHAVFGVCPGLITGEIPYIWRDHLYLVLTALRERSVRLPMDGYTSEIAVTGDKLEDLAEQFRSWVTRRRIEDVYASLEETCRVNGLPSGRDGRLPLRFHPMSEEHVRELADEGHVIASHTWSHRILSVLSPAQKRSELSRSKRYLEELLEGPVETIVYPYGGRNEVDDEAISLSRACGYRRGLMNVPDLQVGDDMRIPRFSIPNTTRAPYIDAVLSGLKDTLRGALRRRDGA